MSRHRGAKLQRQYELSSAISLLSPAQLLFVERQPFHNVLPDHYTILMYLFDLSVFQLSLLLLLHFGSFYTMNWFRSNISKPLDFYDILLQNSVPEKLPGNQCPFCAIKAQNWLVVVYCWSRFFIFVYDCPVSSNDKHPQ